MKRRKASEVYRPAVWVINMKYGPFQNGISWVIPASQKRWIHDASFEEIQKVIIADKGKENKYVTMFWIHLMIKNYTILTIFSQSYVTKEDFGIGRYFMSIKSLLP